jgi:DNA adenine methylase
MKPLLKWVGGKSQIIDDVLSHFPRRIRTYHEPFVGGGAVLLAALSEDTIHIDRVRASDNNPHLIAFYKHIQSDPVALHAAIERVFTAYDASEKEEFYYAQRQKFRDAPPSVEKSALLFFLNKTCFRGLYREGPNGFNVPYGHYKTTPKWPTLEELQAMQALLRRVEFEVCDFSVALSRVGEGDFVYADPPYAKETKTSFVGYNTNGFDQDALFKALTKTIFCMSNANVPCVRDFFKGYYEVRIVKARRAINSKNPESTTTEVLVTNVGSQSRHGCGRVEHE